MNKTFVAIFAFLAIFAIVYAVETKGLGCSLCKDFVKEMEKELANEEGTVEEKANKVCDKLTKKHHLLDKLCKELIDKSLEAIVKGIENHETPEKICGDVHFC
uniref:Saposin B-type domain-containing protein n=1 Tax=Panagrolaimus sp. PS1159 TaxID=55785 RepID=A0AC35F732_9BILA